MGHRRIAAVLAMVSLVGCSSVGSVSPLLTDDDAQEEPLLRGTWRDSSGSINLFVPADGHTSYSVYLTNERGDSREFRASLGQLGSVRVLEVLARDPELRTGVAESDLALELYYPVVVDTISATGMTLRLLETDSLKSYLHEKPAAIAHAKRNGVVVITASTKEWRRFLQKYLRRPGTTQEIPFLRLPTPWLTVTTTGAGGVYRSAGPGECQHIPLRKSADPARGLWQARFSSPTRDTLGVHDLDLRLWEPGSTGASRMDIGWGRMSRMYATSHSLPSVELHDSTVVLSVDAGDATGATVRVRVECSVITQIVERDTEEEDP